MKLVQDGCVKLDWSKIFQNNDRVMTNNADWFTMKPLFIGIKSKWHIDCSVASCNTDIQHNYPDYFEKFCKAGDRCATRYKFTEEDFRERRSQKTGLEIQLGEVQVEFDPNY